MLHDLVTLVFFLFVVGVPCTHTDPHPSELYFFHCVVGTLWEVLDRRKLATAQSSAFVPGGGRGGGGDGGQHHPPLVCMDYGFDF